MDTYTNLAALGSRDRDVDFVCVDTETANERRASVCALGVALVSGGEVVATAEELVDPECDFNPFNTGVNGITQERVAGARTLNEAWGDIAAICAGRSLVFHNAAFDVGVLRASAARYGLPGFDADVTCTMRVARATWPEFPSYGLAVLCNELGIDLDHHQAGSDALGCAEVSLRLLEAIDSSDLAGLHAHLGMRPAVLSADSFSPTWTQSTVIADPSADPNNPLYGQTVCFTGTLLSMIRRDAADLVARSGGTFVKNMSKKVDLLVVGDGDYIEFADGHRTGKLAKAAELRADGEGPEIVREADFFRMIG